MMKRKNRLLFVLVLALSASCAKAPSSAEDAAKQADLPQEEETADAPPQDEAEDIVSEDEEMPFQNEDSEETAFLKRNIPGLKEYLDEGILAFQNMRPFTIAGDEYIRADLSSGSSKRIFAFTPEFDSLMEYDLLRDCWYQRDIRPVSVSIEEMRAWLKEHGYPCGYVFLGYDEIEENCFSFFPFLSEMDPDAVITAGGLEKYLIIPADETAETEVSTILSEKVLYSSKNGEPLIIGEGMMEEALRVRVTTEEGTVSFYPARSVPDYDPESDQEAFNLGTSEYMRLRANSSAVTYSIVNREPAYARGGEIVCRDETKEISGYFCWIADYGIWRDGVFQPSEKFAVSDDYEHIYTLKDDGSFSEIPDPDPVRIHYENEILADLYEFEEYADGSEYSADVVFTAETDVKDFKLLSLEFTGIDEAGQPEFSTEEVFELPVLSHERPLSASLSLPGTLPSYGISYTDANGWTKRYYIVQSGMDGSLSLAGF